MSFGEFNGAFLAFQSDFETTAKFKVGVRGSFSPVVGEEVSRIENSSVCLRCIFSPSRVFKAPAWFWRTTWRPWRTASLWHPARSGVAGTVGGLL